MRPGKRCLAAAMTALLTIPLTGCFEDPVQEHVHLTIQGPGQVVVTVVQKVAPSERAQRNEELADRIETSRYAVDHGLDPWSRRIALLEPVAERETAETIDGELRRVMHSAILPSFDGILPLLEADGITGNLATGGGITELQLFPTGGSRATAIQRQEAERRLAEWSDHLAGYFEAVGELYNYLESRPDRAVPCFAHIFDNHGEGEAYGPLGSEEEELVQRTQTEMERVAEALLVPADAAYSLNELVRLVFDPFPARLTISVDGQVLENRGLIPTAGVFERPAVDTWNALRSLEGRWISPDLVTAMVSPAPDDLQPEPDPAVYAALNRRWSAPPTPAEVESAILSRLHPEDLLSLRWRAPAGGPESEPTTTALLSAISSAEATVPD